VQRKVGTLGLQDFNLSLGDFLGPVPNLFHPPPLSTANPVPLQTGPNRTQALREQAALVGEWGPLSEWVFSGASVSSKGFPGFFFFMALGWKNPHLLGFWGESLQP